LCELGGRAADFSRRVKMKRLAILAAALLLAVGFAQAVPEGRKSAAVTGRLFKGEIWDQACAKRGSHDVMAREAGIPSGPRMARKCTLLCHEMGSPLVLYNPSTRKIYKLDDQKKAVPFAGKKVEITGILDPATNTIHIERITAGH
jgi:hypothetical protein